MKKILLILAFMSFMNTNCTPSTEDYGCIIYCGKKVIQLELEKNSNLKTALEKGNNPPSGQVYDFCRNFSQKHSDLFSGRSRPEYTTQRYCTCMLVPKPGFLNSGYCTQWA